MNLTDATSLLGDKLRAAQSLNSAYATVASTYAVYIAASRKLWDLRRYGERPEIVRKADATMRLAAAEYNDAEAEAREAFADSRGWIYDRKRYASPSDRGKYGRRIVKHPEFFRDLDGAYVGMITHTAATLEEVAGYAARNGYNVELLPLSWDAPDYHTAVLFTLKVGAKWP